MSNAWSSGVQDEVLELLVGEALDLRHQAVLGLGRGLGIADGPLHERRVQGISVELDESNQLIEFSLVPILDQGDLKRLPLEEATGDGALGRRRVAVHVDARDLPSREHSLTLLGPEFGAEPVAERVVHDGKVITAAGVSAGIDMALHLAREIAGEEVAQAIQLGIEYDPAPPFDAGSPEKAPPATVDFVRGIEAGFR